MVKTYNNEIKKIVDWMHDDITWCGSQCNNIECFRNMANKRLKTGLFSMSMLKDTDLCPLKEQKEPEDEESRH